MSTKHAFFGPSQDAQQSLARRSSHSKSESEMSFRKATPIPDVPPPKAKYSLETERAEHPETLEKLPPAVRAKLLNRPPRPARLDRTLAGQSDSDESQTQNILPKEGA